MVEHIVIQGLKFRCSSFHFPHGQIIYWKLNGCKFAREKVVEIEIHFTGGQDKRAGYMC